MGKHGDMATHIDESYHHMQKYAAVFALLKACSQINAEAATLAYGLNTFSFPGYMDITSFTALLAGKREIRAIRKIRITYDVVRLRDPTGLWSQLTCFRGLEEIKINFDGEDLDSLTYNRAWLQTLLNMQRKYKPGVRIIIWQSIIGLSSVKYH